MERLGDGLGERWLGDLDRMKEGDASWTVTETVRVVKTDGEGVGVIHIPGVVRADEEFMRNVVNTLLIK